MAQGNRSSRPKTICCRCRRRADGASRLTNLGWLCDNCYDLLHRSALGRRLYRLVYQLSRRDVEADAARRRPLAEAGAGRAAGREREEEPVGVLAAR